MACPRCGCKTTYQYLDGDDVLDEYDDEELERCAACGSVFYVEDHLPESEDEPR